MTELDPPVVMESVLDCDVWNEATALATVLLRTVDVSATKQTKQELKQNMKSEPVRVFCAEQLHVTCDKQHGQQAERWKLKDP